MMKQPSVEDMRTVDCLQLTPEQIDRIEMAYDAVRDELYAMGKVFNPDACM